MTSASGLREGLVAHESQWRSAHPDGPAPPAPAPNMWVVTLRRTPDGALDSASQEQVRWMTGSWWRYLEWSREILDACDRASDCLRRRAAAGNAADAADIDTLEAFFADIRRAHAAIRLRVLRTVALMASHRAISPDEIRLLEQALARESDVPPAAPVVHVHVDVNMGPDGETEIVRDKHTGLITGLRPKSDA